LNYSHSDITVVVCTANRAKQAESFIRDFLKRFVKTQLIIVENSFSEEFFNHLTQEFEGESELIVLRSFPPGLSNARNLGLKHVKTKLVAFTDDDCVPENDWIESIIDSKLWNEVSAIGGKIVALNEVVTTNLSKIVRESLALLDHGNRIKVLDENEYIYGANMAFKFADVSCLQFKDSLGRKGSNLLSGEDIDFQIQMRNSGLKIGYDPTSIIKHEIELERLNPSWLMKRFAWQGATDAVMYGNGNQWLHDALEIWMLDSISSDTLRQQL
jgi:GT2 family glycosyltransferase